MNVCLHVDTLMTCFPFLSLQSFIAVNSQRRLEFKLGGAKLRFPESRRVSKGASASERAISEERCSYSLLLTPGAQLEFKRRKLGGKGGRPGSLGSKTASLEPPVNIRR